MEVCKKLIAIASDHAGVSFRLKLISYFQQKNIEFIDFGTKKFSTNDSGMIVCETADYPEFAERVCRSILNGESEKGILISSTGIEMSIAANRFCGIFAALCKDEFTARIARLHSNANVLCIGENTTSESVILPIAEMFLNTKFEGGNYEECLKQIEDYGSYDSRKK